MSLLTEDDVTQVFGSPFAGFLHDQLAQPGHGALVLRSLDGKARPGAVFWGPTKTAKTLADALASDLDEWESLGYLDPHGTVTIPATMKSRTQQALDILAADPSRPIYSIAKELGITDTAIHRAIARQKDKTVCPCCGQIVRQGFEIDKSVLKGAR